MTKDSTNSFDSSIKYDMDSYTNLSLDSNKTYALSPSVTYSTNPSDVITYTLGSYNNQSPPSWASINSTTGKLNLNTPILSTETNYCFSIITQITGKPSSVTKAIYLTVEAFVPWNVQNCAEWVSRSSTNWQTWINGYNLNQGNNK